MDASKVSVVKILEKREGAVFKSEIVKRVWIPFDTNSDQEIRIARHHGGDYLANTGDCVFGARVVDPMGQEQKPEVWL